MILSVTFCGWSSPDDVETLTCPSPLATASPIGNSLSLAQVRLTELVVVVTGAVELEDAGDVVVPSPWVDCTSDTAVVNSSAIEG